MEQYVTGIDIGTGSIKAVAVNTKGETIASDLVFYDLTITEQGYSEHDPGMIWKAFIQIMKQMKVKLKVPPEAICFSSYMHGLMAVDSNCEPLTLIMTWADTRSKEIAKEIRNSEVGRTLYEQTGTPVHSMSPLCKILWLKRFKEEIYLNTYKFISIKEYIWFRISGKFQVDHSIASATGLFNIRSLNWNKESLEICGITESKLSEPVPAHTVVKGVKLNKNNFFYADTAFFIGASDGCLAVPGSGAEKKGSIALTIGTSAAARLFHNDPIIQYPEMLFNYILEKDSYVSGGALNNGGNVIQWLMNKFLDIKLITPDSYSVLFKKIDTIRPGSENLLFFPYLNGERFPFWDEKLTGCFIGITENHTIAHFLRAAIEGVCFALNRIIHEIEKYTSVKEVYLSGGFIHSKEWVQMLADICGKPLHMEKSEDASAIGAVMLAMKYLDLIFEFPFSGDDTSNIIFPEKKTHIQYEEHFKNYTRKSYIIQQLNEI